MKIAIVHDWLVTNAGAEKVLQSIIELYPDADIFSLVNFLTKEEREEILHSKKVTNSFLQKLPFAKKYFRYYLALFPLAIESLNLKSYDLIISSSWAVAKGIKKSPKQLHISYCHTPIRYAWDLYEEYTYNLPPLKKFFVKMTLEYLRQWDKASSPRVNYFIANSHFVSQRIRQTYGRVSEVIYPPVDTKNFKLCKNKEDFFLTASRLVPYKKTKLIVEAFNKMPDKKLLVIGDGEEFQVIQAIAKENILLCGYQSQENLTNYMQKAKAFVYAALEDFGIVPIEALACGTPVIALNKGGTQETIEDTVSGIHFEKQTVDSLIEAVKKFEQTPFNADTISQSSQKYSKARFQKEFKEFVEKATFEYNHTDENK